MGEKLQKMNLQSVLWSALVGAVLLLTTMAGSWASGVTTHQAVQDQRLDSAETAEAAHEQELKDIHEDLLRIEKLLEDRHGSH